MLVKILYRDLLKKTKVFDNNAGSFLLGNCFIHKQTLVFVLILIFEALKCVYPIFERNLKKYTNLDNSSLDESISKEMIGGSPQNDFYYQPNISWQQIVKKYFKSQQSLVRKNIFFQKSGITCFLSKRVE